MQNVRHVFEIATAILKFKMTVKFHSQMITNFLSTHYRIRRAAHRLFLKVVK